MREMRRVLRGGGGLALRLYNGAVSDALARVL
jgi:hypothetical protein